VKALRPRWPYECEDCTLVAQMAEGDVYLREEELEPAMLVVVAAAGVVRRSGTDLIFGDVRVSVRAARFYTAERDLLDLIQLPVRGSL
jgi:hypothetical protein